MRASILQWICIGVILGGCSRAAPKDAKERVVSNEPETPPGWTWRRARVEARFSPPSTTDHVLVVESDSKKKEWSLFRETRKAEAQSALDARYQVTFAADGHALVATSGGRARYVALDTGGDPFSCEHATYTHAPSADALSAAPSTRALMLEILATSEGGRHWNASAPDAESAFGKELERAIAYSAKRSGDAEVDRALAEALVRPGRQAHGAHVYDDVTGPAKRDPALRPVLKAALDRNDPAALVQRARAALALAGTDDEAIQVSTARALRAALGTPEFRFGVETHCTVAKQMAWSLAKTTRMRGGGNREVLDAFVQALKHPSTEGACAALGTHAIRGLRAVSNPEARAQVDAIAKRGCDAAAPEWTFDVAEWEHTGDKGPKQAAPLTCWATAALSSWK